jgi:hypothetical protein
MISLRVERVVKALLHDVQRTVVGVSPGWTCFKGIPPSCLRRRRIRKQQPTGCTPAQSKTLPGPRPFPRPGAIIEAEAEDPADRSGEESVDEKPDRHPSGDCERSEDDKESAQLATRLSLGLGPGLLFTCPGKSIAGSGFRFDKRLSEDQEPLHILIVSAEQDAGALSGVTPMAGLQEKL